MSSIEKKGWVMKRRKNENEATRNGHKDILFVDLPPALVSCAESSLSQDEALTLSEEGQCNAAEAASFPQSDCSWRKCPLLVLLKFV